MADAQIFIVLNGDRHAVSAKTGLLALIDGLGLPVQAVLIEYNGSALLRDEWAEVCLTDGDRVEILRVVAGG